MKLRTIIILSTFALGCVGEDLKSADQHKWKDPNDPTIRVRQTSTAVQHVAERCEVADSSLRLILERIMREIDVDLNDPAAVYKTVRVTLSKHATSLIAGFVGGRLENNDANREKVRSALTNVFSKVEEEETPMFVDWLDTIRPYLTMLNLFLLPAAALVVAKALLRPRNFWVIIVSTIVLVSVYTTYNKKYQEAEARRLAEFEKARNSKDPCAPEGIAQRLFESLTSVFLYRKKSNCLTYIESQAVSIFHEISILETFSEVVAGGFFALLSGTGKHINLFFRDLYNETPLLVQIVMTIFLLLVVGTVRTPFFTYEPLLMTFGANVFGRIATWIDGNGDAIENHPQIGSISSAPSLSLGSFSASRDAVEGPHRPCSSCSERPCCTPLPESKHPALTSSSSQQTPEKPRTPTRTRSAKIPDDVEALLESDDNLDPSWPAANSKETPDGKTEWPKETMVEDIENNLEDREKDSDNEYEKFSEILKRVL